MAVEGANTTGLVIVGSVKAEDAIIEGPAFIGDDTRLGAGARIASSVLGTGVIVEGASEIVGSLVMRGSTIGTGCVMEDCAIGEECRIAPGTRMIGCVLGDHVAVDATAILVDQRIE